MSFRWIKLIRIVSLLWQSLKVILLLAVIKCLSVVFYLLFARVYKRMLLWAKSCFCNFLVVFDSAWNNSLHWWSWITPMIADVVLNYDESISAFGIWFVLLLLWFDVVFILFLLLKRKVCFFWLLLESLEDWLLFISSCRFGMLNRHIGYHLLLLNSFGLSYIITGCYQWMFLKFFKSKLTLLGEFIRSRFDVFNIQIVLTEIFNIINKSLNVVQKIWSRLTQKFNFLQKSMISRQLWFKLGNQIEQYWNTRLILNQYLQLIFCAFWLRLHFIRFKLKFIFHTSQKNFQ